MKHLHDLDAALAASRRVPVLIFKHSITCGRSAWAYERLEDWFATSDPGDVELFVVEVLTEREASNAIARRFKIRHESPQLLLIRNEQLLWHASHGGVTEQAIDAALKRLAVVAP